MSVDLRTATGILADRRQAVLAKGSDAVSFLQGQLSQDVAALAPGDTAFSLVLQPQGKVSAWFRITRTDDDAFVLDVDAGWADEIVTRLNRFKLRTAIDIEIAPWQAVTIVGPQADDVDIEGAELDLLGSWAGVPVRDVFGANLEVDASDLVELAEGDVDALRIEAGVPRMGIELDESTIPAAAGIVDQSVSFTKGCYTGQELVARIDSRGNNVPKRLLPLVITGDRLPAAGAEIVADDGPVGEVTSAAHSTHLGAIVALGYLRRGIDPGTTVAIAVADGAASAEVRELPLVRG